MAKTTHKDSRLFVHATIEFFSYPNEAGLVNGDGKVGDIAYLQDQDPHTLGAYRKKGSSTWEAVLQADIDAVKFGDSGITTTNTLASNSVRDSETEGDGDETIEGRFERTADLSYYAKDSSGNKVTGESLALTIGGSAVGITTASFTFDTTTIDSTDSLTPAGETEVTDDFVSRTGTIELINDTDNPRLAFKTNLAFVLTFATDNSITANARLTDLTDAKESGSNNLETYSVSFQGSATIVGLGLNSSAEYNFLDIAGQGKGQIGKFTVISKSIDSSAEGTPVEISDTLRIQGGVTEFPSA